MNNTDITAAIHNHYAHLDLEGVTASNEGEGNNWGYRVVCDDFILEGVSDTLTEAVDRAHRAVRALRQRGVGNPSAHISPSR